jgi:hypothetical protein
MGARTPRERRLWIAAGSLVLAIYTSAYFVQFALAALRVRGWLGPTVWVGLALAAGVALVFAARARPGAWEVALFGAAAGVYLLLIRRLGIIQERIHLIEYGLVGGLVYEALRERWSVAERPRGTRPWRQRFPALAAVLIATAAGWGDELVQAVLPNRYYDLRDVVTNAEAAALLVLVLAVRHALRERAAAGVGYGSAR